MFVYRVPTSPTSLSYTERVEKRYTEPNRQIEEIRLAGYKRRASEVIDLDPEVGIITQKNGHNSVDKLQKELSDLDKELAWLEREIVSGEKLVRKPENNSKNDVEMKDVDSGKKRRVKGSGKKNSLHVSADEQTLKKTRVNQHSVPRGNNTQVSEPRTIPPRGSRKTEVRQTIVPVLPAPEYNRPRKRRKIDPRKPNDEPLDLCKKLLMDLMKENWAWPFNEPVDTVKLDIPDYYDIITKPMDLGTIKQNLNQGLYGSVLEFAEDVRLVFKNARTYNRPEQDVWYMAGALSDLFEEKYASIVVQAKSEDPKKKKEHMQQVISNLVEIEKRQKSTLEELNKKREKDMSPPIRPVEELSTSVISYDDKVVLRKFINDLDMEYLKGVITILQETKHPKLKSDSKSFDVNINRLDNQTLRRLEAYMNDCKAIMPPEVLEKFIEKKNLDENGLSAASSHAKAVDSTPQQIEKLTSSDAEMKESTEQPSINQNSEGVIVAETTKEVPSVNPAGEKTAEESKESSSSSSSSDTSDSSSDSDDEDIDIKLPLQPPTLSTTQQKDLVSSTEQSPSNGQTENGTSEKQENKSNNNESNNESKSNTTETETKIQTKLSPTNTIDTKPKTSNSLPSDPLSTFSPLLNIPKQPHMNPFNSYQSFNPYLASIYSGTPNGIPMDSLSNPDIPLSSSWPSLRPLPMGLHPMMPNMPIHPYHMMHTDARMMGMPHANLNPLSPPTNSTKSGLNNSLTQEQH